MLAAAESYYGEQPFFTTVIMKIIPDATQRVQLLQQVALGILRTVFR